MPLISCPVCEGQVSDQAETCCHCGHPLKKRGRSVEQKGPYDAAWSAATKTRTPVNVFSVAMMACAAILGVAATQINNPEALTAFTYALHLFFGVSGMFFAILLFCRKGLYHPRDLAKAKQAGVDNFGIDRPDFAGILILIVVVAYGVYHIVNGPA